MICVSVVCSPQADSMYRGKFSNEMLRVCVCVCTHARTCKPEVDLDVNPQKPAPLFLGGRVSLELGKTG